MSDVVLRCVINDLGLTDEKVLIPSGDYGMETFVTLTGANAWALQLDGIIFRMG